MFVAVTLVTPLLAFGGAVLGVALNRRGAHELESRSLREETMRNVRWAAELALESDATRASLGMAQLRALGQVDLLDAFEQAMVRAALVTLSTSSVDDEEWT